MTYHSISRMQIDKKFYDPAQHDCYKALTIRQPFADLLTRVAYRGKDGEYHAMKSIIVRTKRTSYRGDLLVCSSRTPCDLVGLHPTGVTCGFVELYDIKPVEEFTEADWDAACWGTDKRPSKGWGWMLRNPRRVVEMPVSGTVGMYDIIVPKGDITEYPRAMAFGKEGWKLVLKQIKK